MTSAPVRPPLWDSPWFWVELFCCAALLGTLVIGNKYEIRQARLERRSEALQTGHPGEEAPLPERKAAPDTDEALPVANLREALGPIRWVLIGVLIVSQLARVWSRVRKRGNSDGMA